MGAGDSEDMERDSLDVEKIIVETMLSAWSFTGDSRHALRQAQAFADSRGCTVIWLEWNHRNEKFFAMLVKKDGSWAEYVRGKK